MTSVLKPLWLMVDAAFPFLFIMKMLECYYTLAYMRLEMLFPQHLGSLAEKVQI